MFKSKRRKELEQKENELFVLKSRITEMRHFCAFDSPEIGFAMLYLQQQRGNIDIFRDGLRQRNYTFDSYKKLVSQ